jgi:hypothetical protein
VYPKADQESNGGFVMEQWIAFARDNWPVIVIAVVVAIVLIRIVKSVLKWLLVLVIAAAVLIYGFNYAPEELMQAGSMLRDAVESTKEKAIGAVLGETGEARYEKTEDGFLVEGERFTLKGKDGETGLILEYFGQQFVVEMNEQLRAFLEKVKDRSS